MRRDLVADVARRARYAKAALLAIGASYGVFFATALWVRSLLIRASGGEAISAETWGSVGSFSDGLQVLNLVLRAAAGIAFLAWLLKATEAARAMGERPFRWTSSRALLSFFVPIVNLVRPYQVLRDVHDAFAFESLPTPKPRVTEAGYREARVVEPPPPPTLARPLIALWWATYMIGAIVGWVANSRTGETLAELIAACNVSAVHGAIEVAGTLLAVRVVTAVTARAVERQRRRKFAPPTDAP